MFGTNRGPLSHTMQFILNGISILPGVASPFPPPPCYATGRLSSHLPTTSLLMNIQPTLQH